MYRFARLLALTLTVGCLSAAVANDASACRCKEPPPERAYRDSAAVVRARVTKFVPAPEGEGGTAILSVLKAWKKDVPTELAVTTLTSCAYPFQEQHDYVLFLVQDHAVLYSTGRCLGNQTLDEAKGLLDWLRKHGEQKSIRKPTD
jgi:hypothetical protein